MLNRDAEIRFPGGRRVRVERRKLPPSTRPPPADEPVMTGPRNSRELSALLKKFSSMARRIPPSAGGRNPHAFHEAKSELARELDKLADWAFRQP